MGLDLVVEGSPRPGHEAEWRQILQRSFDGEPAEGDEARFGEISSAGYERVGAPRVGTDQAADDWIIARSGAQSKEDKARILQEMRGFYVLPLVSCAGLPNYTHAGLYDGVDETSFRGSFLTDCVDVLSRALVDDAWNHKFPEEAIRYGQALLDAAAGTVHRSKPGIFSRIGFGKKAGSSIAIEEQVEIVRSAGQWFIFWGERGHAIRAWF